DSDQVVAPLDWVSFHKLFGTAAPGGDVSPTEESAPTQVVLVDWIQCLRKAYTAKVGAEFRPRIGVVVAAWDRLPTEQQDTAPLDWITSNFPLLGQFLRTNMSRFEFRFFGVSVVGGDLKNDAKFRADYKGENPNEAGYVVV